MRPSFSIGIEEEYQTVDPVTFDLRSHIQTELMAQGKRRDEGEGQVGDAPGGGGGRHGRVPRHGRGPRGLGDVAAADGVVGARTRAGAGGGGHASVCRLARAGHLTRRALPAGGRGHAARGPLEPDLRAARAHRRGGSRDGHPPDEPDPLFPAAPAGAVGQLTVLAGHEHRPAVVPLQGVRQVPAHQHPRHLHRLGRLRELRQPAHPHQLHRQRQEDLVGRAAASVLSDHRDPHLRPADARRRDAGHRGPDPGHGLHAVEAAREEPGVAALQPGADHGEQVARGALRHRRLAHRLRARAGDARTAADRRVP